MGIALLFQLFQRLPNRIDCVSLPPHFPDNHAAGKRPENIHLRKRRLHCTLYSTDGMLPGVCIACPKADHQNRFLDSRHFTICQRRGIRQISALSLFLEQFQRLWLGQHPEQLHPVKIVRYGLFPRPPQNAQAGTDLTVRCSFGSSSRQIAPASAGASPQLPPRSSHPRGGGVPGRQNPVCCPD